MPTPHPRPSNATRFIITVLIGPMLGALVFMLSVAAPEFIANPTRIPDPLIEGVELLALAWILGLVPAVIAATAMAMLLRWHPALAANWLIQLALGGLAGWLGMNALLLGLGMWGQFDHTLDLTAIIAGALALRGATLIFERFAVAPNPRGR